MGVSKTSIGLAWCLTRGIHVVRGRSRDPSRRRAAMFGWKPTDKPSSPLWAWVPALRASTHPKIGLDLVLFGPYHEHRWLPASMKQGLRAEPSMFDERETGLPCRAQAEASAQLGTTPPVVTPSKRVLAVDVEHCPIGCWSRLALNICRSPRHCLRLQPLRQASEQALWPKTRPSGQRELTTGATL
jgi:hypothetical protein